jgi:hypothetical protein
MCTWSEIGGLRWWHLRRGDRPRVTLLVAGAGTVAVSMIGLVAYGSLPVAVKRRDPVP